MGTQPDAIAVTPDGSTAEVVNFDDDTVTPIDTATNNPGAPMSAGNDPWDIAITPDQGPVAALSVAPANAGQPTSFNASASTAPSSPIVNYAWNFGDGNTTNTSVPTTTHTYAHQGTYTASLTETDAAGTSLTKVFTGQTMSREGGPQARTSSTFDVGVVTSDTCVVPGFRTSNFPRWCSNDTPTLEHRRRWNLPDRPRSRGQHPRLGHQPLPEPRGDVADGQRPDDIRGWQDDRRGPERCGQSEHRVDVSHQPAPERPATWRPTSRTPTSPTTTR